MTRAAEIAPYWEAAVHALKGRKHVTDIRNFGLAAGITLEAVPGEPAKRPFEVAMKCLDKGIYVRYGADTIQMAPPFISEKAEIERMVSIVARICSMFSLMVSGSAWLAKEKVAAASG